MNRKIYILINVDINTMIKLNKNKIIKKEYGKYKFYGDKDEC